MQHVKNHSRDQKSTRRGSLRRRTLSAFLLIGLMVSLSAPSRASINLQITSGAGVPVTGTHPSYTISFGTTNGLGVGTAPSGTTVVTAFVQGGVIYSTAVNITVTGLPSGDAATLSVYVSSPFSHPSNIKEESCLSNCTVGYYFAPISTNAASPNTFANIGNGVFGSTFGLFIASTNGAGAFIGSDADTVTVIGKDNTTGETDQVTLSATVTTQTAVQLGFNPVAGGAATTSWGNVNGLAVGTSLTGLSQAASSGSAIYSSAYSVAPAFSGFSSSTCTLTTYVSTSFVNTSSILMQWSASASGPWTNVSSSSGTPTVLTTTAASGSAPKFYFATRISAANGSGAFPGLSSTSGADSATLQFQMSVP